MEILNADAGVLQRRVLICHAGPDGCWERDWLGAAACSWCWSAARAVLGAFFITLIEELLWTKMPSLHLTTYGVILLLVGFYLPGGLIRMRWLTNRLSRGKT